jgi:hypothetical protein
MKKKVNALLLTLKKTCGVRKNNMMLVCCGDNGVMTTNKWEVAAWEYRAQGSCMHRCGR